MIVDYQPQTGGGLGTAITPTSATVSSPDNEVAARVLKITQQDSPLMRQAKTQGMKTANQRGLSNSSIASGAAMNSMIGAAAPIASQDSQQEHARDVNTANLAAAERERQLAAYTQMQSTYAQSLANTLNNHEIPSSARNAVQQSLRDQLTAGMSFMENLYGVDLGYGSPAPTTPAPYPYYDYGGLGGLGRLVQ